MENKNLTAVEWLLKEQFNLMMDSDKLSKRQYLGRKFKIEEQAKQMQKHQHTSTFFAGKCYIISKEKEIIEEFGNNSAPNFEQYYKETYGK